MRSENIFSKNMGMRKYFGKKYGGSKYFAIFSKHPPTGYQVLKNTNTLHVIPQIYRISSNTYQYPRNNIQQESRWRLSFVEKR